MRGNLEIQSPPIYFWTGRAFHFGMEDYYGYNRYGRPSLAVQAYVEGHRRAPRLSLPDGWEDEIELLTAMLDYYVDVWQVGRPEQKTFYWDGKPQVEVRFEIDLTPFINPDILERSGYTKVIYRGTMDRVVIDSYDRLFIVDYKTTKNFDRPHFPTDQQITAYMWACTCLYPGYEVAGFIYQQHRKIIPEEPKLLAKGRLSANKQQVTSYAIYYKALKQLYGDVSRAPAENINCLNHFALAESTDHDAFIRRDWVYRNEHQLQAEGTKILLELEDMLNPDLPLYPNPTSDCSWDCQLVDACVSMDDGSDWESSLSELTKPFKQEDEAWRQYLP